MIEFSSDPVHAFQVVRVSGVVAGDEVLAIYRELLASPEFDPRRNVLLNISDVERFDFGYEVINQVDGLLKQIDGLGIQHRMAIVAAGDYQYGMARMFANVRFDSPQHIEVFRDKASAREWLTG